MMIKLFCSLVIVLGCSYVGVVAASRLDTRVIQIDDFINAFKYLDAEISMNNSVISDAAARVSEAQSGVVSDIFRDVSDELSKRSGISAYEVWCSVMDKYKNSLLIGDGTINTIKEFSKCLGQGTRKTESENIKSVCEKLKVSKDEAMTVCAKNSRLFKSLGLAFGILITVLLL